MQSFVTLRKTGLSWEFETEEALEDFLFSHLDEILGWTVIKRQYIVNGQRCDLLATDKIGRLVVIELKNVEDRGIVQQLTRYYHALLEEQPFSDRIDYEKPVNLVAIAPSFHRDNLTDRKYHHLKFEFFQFSIVQEDNKFYLQVENFDKKVPLRIRMQSDLIRINDSFPSHPKLFRDLLSKCTLFEQEAIIQIRQKILKFDTRIQEYTSNGSVKYGKGNKFCVELRFDNRRGSPIIFLWLPLISRRSGISRMMIWTNWKIVSDIAYVCKGIGSVKSEAEFSDKIAREEWPKKRYNYCSLKSSYQSKYSVALPFTIYVHRMRSKGDNANYMELAPILEQPNSLEMLVDIALKKWLERV